MNRHILQYNLPAISYKFSDHAHLTFINAVARLFPKTLQTRRNLPLALIDCRLRSIYPEPLSYHELLASAYFGYLAIPASYQQFCNSAEQINRGHTSPDADQRKRHAKQRETEAAQEFGIRSRDGMRQVYDTLNSLAQNHNFGSYKAIWDWSNHLQDSCDYVTAAERDVFAAGPRYLLEFAQQARKLEHADIVFSTIGQWVLYVHRDVDGVNAYPIFPASLRRAIFKESVLAIAPDEVLSALRDLAQHHFPDTPRDGVKIIELPMIAPVRVLPAELATPEA